MLATLAVAASLGAAAAERVVARVDGAPISAAAAADRARALRSQGSAASPDEVLRSLVEDALLAAEGERLGLAAAGDTARQIDVTRRRLASERFLERELAVRPDEAALRAAFHGAEDTARLRLVVRATREEAQAALERLRRGAAFADEATASLDPDSARRGGDAGTLQRLAMEPAVAEVAFSGPTGKPLGPVALAAGWAVVEVAERHVGSDEAFRERRPVLETFVAARMQAEARRHVLAQLRRRRGVTLDEKFLDGTGTRASARGDEGEHVVARVGALEIRYRDVLGGLEALSRGREGSHFSSAPVKKELAWALVDRALLEEEALARGYGEEAEVRRRLALERRTLVGVAAAQRIRAGAASASEAEVEAQYRAHAAEYRRPARRECWQIVAPSREAAEALRARLSAGEPFEEVARRASVDDGTSRAGGRIGEIGFDRLEAIERGGDPELARAVREARPGEVGAPVRGPQGWHLLRCGPVSPAGPAPLAEVRASIAARLASERASLALDQALASLRDRARVTIVDRPLLERAVASTP